jgi:hypothetical protein
MGQEPGGDQQVSHVIGGTARGEAVEGLVAERDGAGAEPVQKFFHVVLVEPDDQAVGLGGPKQLGS